MTVEFVRIAGVDDLVDGQMKRVDLGGYRLMVARVDGEYLVSDDMCTHEDASLATGCLRGEWVKCPLHGSRFNLRTGEVMDDPADEPLRIYPVRVESGDVLVELEIK